MMYLKASYYDLLERHNHQTSEQDMSGMVWQPLLLFLCHIQHKLLSFSFKLFVHRFESSLPLYIIWMCICVRALHASFVLVNRQEYIGEVNGHFNDEKPIAISYLL